MSAKTEIERAEKYVKRLKSWYWFIPINILTTAFLGALSFLMYQNDEPNTIIWILMSSAIGLWIVFIVEGIVLKRPKIIRSWEDKNIKKYIIKIA